MHYYANLLNANHPNIDITGASFICPNETNVYQATGSNQNISSYSWSTTGSISIVGSIGATGSGSLSNISVKETGIDGGSLILETNCGHKTTVKTIDGIDTLEINSPNIVCPGTQYNFSVPNFSGANYAWTVDGGIIIKGQGTSVLEIQIEATTTNETYIECLIENYCSTNITAQSYVPHLENCVDNSGNYEQSPITPFSFSFNQQEFSIFPNPTSSNFKIYSKDLSKGQRFQYIIYDIFGNKISEGNSYNSNIIETKNIGTGIYFVSIFLIAFSPSSLENNIPNDVAEILNKLNILENGQLENPTGWGKLGISEGLSNFYPEAVYGVKYPENSNCFGDYTNLEFYRTREESPLENETIKEEFYCLIKQSINTIDTLYIKVVESYVPFTINTNIKLNGNEIEPFYLTIDDVVYNELYVKVLE
ncbi:T9SS type A sorting domain-containing protein [Patiriisocius marinus]|uniref:T9SS type A sorting domain-containing protein n=1 Tax=Patiriisocius marinus TaxID=1397112 RepID=UPI00232CA7BF|nr:T9SS type A sorting domain-containing protein [Patiriisocius marinus]